jgi:hypothetical protein
MKRLVLFLMVCAVPVWSDVFDAPLSNKTRAGFLAVCAGVSSHSVVAGDFELRRSISALKRTMASSGTYFISRDKGMVWNTEKPFPSTMVMGTDYIVQSVPGGKPSVISAAGNEAFTRMAEVMRSVFTGNADALLKSFKVYFDGAPDNWRLGLIPTDRTVRAFADRFTLAGNGGSISRVEMAAKNGDTSTYILTNYRFREALAPEEAALFR